MPVSMHCLSAMIFMYHRIYNYNSVIFICVSIIFMKYSSMEEDVF
jgi:hypothetical protein